MQVGVKVPAQLMAGLSGSSPHPDAIWGPQPLVIPLAHRRHYHSSCGPGTMTKTTCVFLLQHGPELSFRLVWVSSDTSNSLSLHSRSAHPPPVQGAHGALPEALVPGRIPPPQSGPSPLHRAGPVLEGPTVYGTEPNSQGIVQAGMPLPSSFASRHCPPHVPGILQDWLPRGTRSALSTLSPPPRMSRSSRANPFLTLNVPRGRTSSSKSFPNSRKAE